MTMARSSLRMTRARKRAGGILLGGEHVLFAAAGVDQQAERHRQLDPSKGDIVWSLPFASTRCNQ